MLLAPAPFELIDCRDRGVCRREHRIDDDDEPFGRARRAPEIILNWLERLVVPVDAIWATRAAGTRSSMPSSRPLPARMIEANTSFLPLMVGASIVVMGVSIGIIRARGPRVTS